MKINFMCFWVSCKHCKHRETCDIDYEKVIQSSLGKGEE